MDLLRYGITARTVEMVCFDAALERLSSLCPDLDINAYKKRVKKEYRAMLARTPDIGGSLLWCGNMRKRWRHLQKRLRMKGL